MEFTRGCLRRFARARDVGKVTTLGKGEHVLSGGMRIRWDNRKFGGIFRRTGDRRGCKGETVQRISKRLPEVGLQTKFLCSSCTYVCGKCKNTARLSNESNHQRIL